MLSDPALNLCKSCSKAITYRELNPPSELSWPIRLGSSWLTASLLPNSKRLIVTISKYFGLIVACFYIIIYSAWSTKSPLLFNCLKIFRYRTRPLISILLTLLQQRESTFFSSSTVIKAPKIFNTSAVYSYFLENRAVNKLKPTCFKKGIGKGVTWAEVNFYFLKWRTKASFRLLK